MQSGVASLSAGSSEPLAAAAQQVPSATGSGDEIDEFVILQGSVNRPELILPQFRTVGPPHLEDAALRHVRDGVLRGNSARAPQFRSGM